jgi:hypothetical protein
MRDPEIMKIARNMRYEDAWQFEAYEEPMVSAEGTPVSML